MIIRDRWAISTFHTDTVCLFIGSILFKIGQKKDIVIIVVAIKLLSIKADHSVLLFKRVLYIICCHVVKKILFLLKNTRGLENIPIFPSIQKTGKKIESFEF